MEERSGDTAFGRRTRIRGSEAVLHRKAAWRRKLPAAVQDLATSAHRQRSRTASWSGDGLARAPASSTRSRPGFLPQKAPDRARTGFRPGRRLNVLQFHAAPTSHHIKQTLETIMKLKPISTAAALVAFATVAHAQGFVIDDFEHGAFHVEDHVADGAAPTLVLGSLPPASVLGGERQSGTLLWNVSMNSPSIFSLDLSGGGDHGVRLEVPAASKAGAGMGYYGPSSAGFSEDLVARGITGFAFTFAQDPGNGTLEMFLNDTSGNALRLSSSIPLTGIKDYMMPLSTFTGPNPDPTGVFGNVHDIFVLMTFTAPGAAVTAELSSITALAAVPEPAEHAAVAGLALVAFGALRRFRW